MALSNWMQISVVKVSLLVIHLVGLSSHSSVRVLLCGRQRPVQGCPGRDPHAPQTLCPLCDAEWLHPGPCGSCLLPLSSLILRFRSPFLQPRLIFPTVSASPPPTSAQAPRYLLLLSVSPPRSSRPLSPHIWSLQPLSPTCPCRSLSRLSLPSLAVSLILSPLESPLLPVSSHQHRRCS